MNVRNKVKFMQDGGAAPAPQGGGAAPQDASQGAAPDQSGAQGGGQDPMAQILQVAAQAVQNQDCQAAMALAEGFMALVAGPEQGASAPPQGAPEGEPVYRKGGTLLRRV